MGTLTFIANLLGIATVAYILWYMFELEFPTENPLPTWSLVVSIIMAILSARWGFWAIAYTPREYSREFLDYTFWQFGSSDKMKFFRFWMYHRGGCIL